MYELASGSVAAMGGSEEFTDWSFLIIFVRHNIVLYL
jgi:hypothetical protein